MAAAALEVEVIGRAAELESVDRFLDRTCDGGGTSLVIDGEAGIGKTALWRATVARARGRGIRILRSAPAESERSLTLGGLTDLLADVTAGELDTLPEVQRHALEIALLRTAPSGRLPDQRTLSVATGGLLRALATETPLVVAVDDAQWLDASSAAILGHALRRVGDRPVGTLLAVRGAAAAFVQEVADAAPPERRDRVHVGPMPLAALHQLFEERLGHSFPRLVLVRIEEASGGNPLYALEIGRELDRHDGTPAGGDPLPIPDSLGSLLEVRVEALPQRTRDALLLAAIATEPTTETLRGVDPAAADALEPATSAGVAIVEREAIRFSHPLLAQAVIQTTSPAEVRRAHLALAASARSEDVRARHLAGAADGPSERVAAALTAAAAGARIRGATLEAAALYGRASELTPVSGPDDALRRAMLAAETLFIDVSEHVEADRMLERAIATGSPGPARAEALSLRALTRYYHGDLPEALRIADQALAEAPVAGSPFARARRALVLGRAAFVVMQADLRRGGALVREALGLIDGRPDADPDVLGNLLLLDASATFGFVEGLDRDEIARGRGLVTPAGRSWEHDGIDGIDFGLARATDDLDRAIAMTLDHIARKAGPGGDDPFNLVMLSELQLRRGEVAAARASAEAADAGYAREGAEVYPAWRLRGLALVAAHDGRHADAQAWAREGLAAAEASGDLVQQLYHHHILGFVALATRDGPVADDQLSRAAELGRAASTLHPGRFKLEGDRVEAALAVGAPDRAAEVVAALERANAVAPTPWTRAIGARARGLLRASTGDLGGAVAALELALREHTALPMPFERARTLLVLGQVHRRRKEKRLADERLREALAAFEGLEARAWADLARAELGRVGLRPRAPDGLTDTERRVAELAATGLSSREIGARVFLAPKTVGNVLGRVYEKLGIRSRAELGARLGHRPGDTARSASGAGTPD